METTNVRLVERTFDVIEALSLYPNGTSIATLTAETGIHKSTIYRLLNTLISRGYVIKNEATSKYQMTLRTYQTVSYTHLCDKPSGVWLCDYNCV